SRQLDAAARAEPLAEADADARQFARHHTLAHMLWDLPRGWIGAGRPSRRTLRALLGMRFFFNATNSLPHPEEARSAVSKDARAVCREVSRGLRHRRGAAPCWPRRNARARPASRR